jgi:hypothetical protein
MVEVRCGSHIDQLDCLPGLSQGGALRNTQPDDLCWGGWPLTASLCQNEVVADLKHRRPSVDHIIRIGMDTSVRRETGKE